VCCLLHAPLQAQTNVLDSDPLRARKLIVYDEIGAYIGPTFNGQGGTIVTDCNCEFTGGASTGFAGGFMFERLTRSRMVWGIMLGYEDKSVEGRFTEIEGVVQRAPSSGAEYTVPITFKNSATASIGYITLMPYLKYNFFDLLFVRGGAALSYIVTSNMTHVKTLASDSVNFPNGETASVSVPNSENGSVVLQDGPIDGLNPFQAGISLASGLDIQVNKWLFLSPVAQYVIPLTKVSSSGDGFSVRSFQIFLEGRLIF